MPNVTKERKGPQKSNRDTVRTATEARAKYIIALARERRFLESCDICNDESCQHFVGLGTDWGDEMLALVSLVISSFTGDPGLEEHEKASGVAMDLLRRRIQQINRHIGGAPRFPLNYPLIDGQDRDWALSKQRECALPQKKAA